MELNNTRILTMLNNEELSTLLRSNLACHLGKMFTQELLDDVTLQIIESIDYLIDKKDEIL